MSDFSERFHKLRKDKGLSQELAGKKLGFNSHAQISRFENGTGFPTFETLTKIVDLFNVDLHWLITGQPAPSVEKVINLLYPFVSSFLSQITEKVNALEKERRELRRDSFDDPVPPFRLEKIQEEIEYLHDYSTSVIKILNEKLDQYRQKPPK